MRSPESHTNFSVFGWGRAALAEVIDAVKVWLLPWALLLSLVAGTSVLGIYVLRTRFPPLLEAQLVSVAPEGHELALRQLAAEGAEAVISVVTWFFVSTIKMLAGWSILSLVSSSFFEFVKMFLLPQKRWAFDYLALETAARRRFSRVMVAIALCLAVWGALWASGSLGDIRSDSLTFFRQTGVGVILASAAAVYAVDRASGIHRFLVHHSIPPGNRLRLGIGSFLGFVGPLLVASIFILVLENLWAPEFASRCDQAQARITSAREVLHAELTREGVDAGVIANLDLRLDHSGINLTNVFEESTERLRALLVETKFLLVLTFGLFMLLKVYIPFVSPEVRAPLAYAGLVLAAAFAIGEVLRSYRTFVGLDSPSLYWSLFALIAAATAGELLKFYLKLAHKRTRACSVCGSSNRIDGYFCTQCGSIQSRTNGALIASRSRRRLHRVDCPAAARIKTRDVVRFPSLEDARAAGVVAFCSLCRPSENSLPEP
jgi:hypothetical protein